MGKFGEKTSCPNNPGFLDFPGVWKMHLQRQFAPDPVFFSCPKFLASAVTVSVIPFFAFFFPTWGLYMLNWSVTLIIAARALINEWNLQI